MSEGRMNGKVLVTVLVVAALAVAGVAVVNQQPQTVQPINETVSEPVPEQQSEEPAETWDEQPLETQPIPGEPQQQEQPEEESQTEPIKEEPQQETPVEPENQTSVEPEPEPNPEPEPQPEPVLVYEKVDLDVTANYTITYVNYTERLKNWTVFVRVTNPYNETVFNVTVVANLSCLEGRTPAVWRTTYRYLWRFESMQPGDVVVLSRDDWYLSGPNGLIPEECSGEAYGYVREQESQAEPMEEEPQQETPAEPEPQPVVVYEKVDLEATANYTVTYVNSTRSLKNWTVCVRVVNPYNETVFNVTVLAKLNCLEGRASLVMQKTFTYRWRFESLWAGDVVVLSRDDGYSSGPNGLMLQECLGEAYGYVKRLSYEGG